MEVGDYCSDTLHMAVVTSVVQGKPFVEVLDGGVSICTRWGEIGKEKQRKGVLEWVEIDEKK